MIQLKDLKVKSKLSLLIGLSTLGLVIFTFVVVNTIDLVKVNGPYYKRIVQGKDLIADILPPPEYLLESYMVVLQIAGESDSQVRQQLALRLDQLEQDYKARHEFWSQNLEAGSLKASMMETSYRPAVAFWEAVRTEFLPAALKGDQASARSVLQGVVTSRYLEHRKAIDEAVRLATDRNGVDETRASGDIRRRTTLIIALAVLILIMVGSLSWVIAGTIAGPLGKAAVVLRAAASGDVDQTIDYQARDEIGQVAEAIRSLCSGNSELASAASALSRGDLGVVPPVRGEKDVLGRAFEQLRENVSGLTSEVRRLAGQAQKGQLSERGDSSRFQGGFKEMVQGFNATLDAIVVPLNVAANYIDRIAKGDTPPKITEEYMGDFNTIKNNLNTCIDSITTLVEEVGVALSAGRDGDLQKRVHADRQTGVYRKILRGLNEILDAVSTPVSETLSALEKVADHDLTARMAGEYKGDYTKIKEALNQAVGNLDQGMQQVSVAVEQVAAAASQIGSGSQTLAQGASEQASSLEEISSSLQEMASQTKANAGNAGEAKGLAEGTRQGANKSLESMQTLSEAMGRIKSSSDSTAKIVKTIDEIAFQTNLLALNAAVEAARAGDAGKGFAVVAEEVRNLAMRSAEAAKHTANLIEESVKNAESGVELNGVVLMQLKEITTQANKVGDVMKEIAAASEQQSGGLDQVARAVEEMDQVTQQNAASSEESASAAEELSGQAEELRTMVCKFRLSAEVARSAGSRGHSTFTRSRPTLQVVAGRSGAAPKARQVDQTDQGPLSEDTESRALGSF